MNNDVSKRRRKQFRGDMKRTWAEISDDEFALVYCERSTLGGLIRECYGGTREQAQYRDRGSGRTGKRADQ